MVLACHMHARARVCMRAPVSVCLYVCGQQERQSQVQCHLDCCWCRCGVVAVTAAVCAALM